MKWNAQMAGLLALAWLVCSLGIATVAQDKSRTESDRYEILKKLNSMRFQKIEFEDTPILAAIDYLVKQGREVDLPDHKGLRIVPAFEKDSSLPTVSLYLRDVTLYNALKFMIAVTGLEMRIDFDTVFIVPGNSPCPVVAQTIPIKSLPPAKVMDGILIEPGYLAVMDAKAKEDYTGLLREAQALVKKFAEDSKAHMILGDAYERLNFKHEAIAAYQQATNLRPDFTLAWYSLGLAYLRFGGYASDASAAFQRVIKLKPDDTDAWSGLACAYEEWGSTEGAITAFKEITKLKPGDVNAWSGLARACEKEERTEDAIVAYKQVIKLKPGDVNAWDGLARVSCVGGHYPEEEGRTKDAIAARKEITKLKPGDVNAWLLLGDAYEQVGRIEDAIAARKEITRLKPGDVNAWLLLSYTYEKAGKKEEAKAVFQKALELDPSRFK